jgi:pimeloyl-ACP methyl ester carboxylesterase
VPWGSRVVSIEHAWINCDSGAAADPRPLLVFLHEGLGSLAMWKGFPQQLCAALNWRGLVYSRPGYGQSTLRLPAENWGPDFMHQQAHQVLPAVLQALGVDVAKQPPWLLGHSDGGSIALLYAAHAPSHAAGLVVMAPHIFVEDIALASIQAARSAYINGDLKTGLARYHASADSAFWGWCSAWLNPAFKNWRITEQLAAIRCPVLALQGTDDAYGTLRQTRGIQQAVPHTQLLDLPDCGHSPHRDQTAAVVAAVQAFVQRAGQPASTTRFARSTGDPR